ncbi:MAG: hypothetical protein R6V50_08135 [Thermoplasmatota archaeon]
MTKELNPTFVYVLLPLLIGLFMMFVIRGPIYGIIGAIITIAGGGLFVMALIYGVNVYK